MNDEHVRQVLTYLILFAMLGPACTFLAGCIYRMLQSFNRYGQAAQRLRNRFLVSKLLLFATGFLGFIAFEDVSPLDSAERVLAFMAGYVAFVMAAGFEFLAWDMWWDGTRPRGRTGDRLFVRLRMLEQRGVRLPFTLARRLLGH